jgi:hypothetical protein
MADGLTKYTSPTLYQVSSLDATGMRGKLLHFSKKCPSGLPVSGGKMKHLAQCR